ncbi:unnamed protein product, partial [Rotaria magnacalcarata]
VANPAALIKHNELEIVEEQLTTSITPSPFGTSKNSELFQRTPTDYSTSVYPFNINIPRKVTLNVGGVRHEGNIFFFFYFILYL